MRNLIITLAAVVVLAQSAAGGVRVRTAQEASLTFVREAAIFSIRPDGTHLSLVVRAPQDISLYEPAWTRDGRRLAVTAESTPTGTITYDEVVTLDAAGKNPTAVCGNSDDGGSPVQADASWAPDGRRLVYADYEAIAGGGLYIARIRPGKCARLTPGNDDSYDKLPAWSPDGSTIAFVRTEGRPSSFRSSLYVIHPDGKGLRQLLLISARNLSWSPDGPSWSPDGKRLTFADRGRIATVDGQGRVASVTYLTGPGAHDSDPAWSPDGRTIAFVRHGSVWLVNATGGGLRLLVRNARQPAWRPS